MPGGGVSELEEQVRSLVEPVLARHSAELVELHVVSGRIRRVRVIADRPGGIDLDTCAVVSNEISRLMDVADPIQGRYTLEVSSPGLDRPLKTAADFTKQFGKKVRIVLALGQHEGTIDEVGDSHVRIGTADGPVDVALTDITTARIILPW